MKLRGRVASVDAAAGPGRGRGRRQERLGQPRGTGRSGWPFRRERDGGGDAQGPGRHRRDRADRVLEELGRLGARARRRSACRRRSTTRGSAPIRSTASPPSRSTPATRSRSRAPSASATSPSSAASPLRRRRGGRHRPPGRDGGRDRRRQVRGGLPRAQRALGPALQPGRLGRHRHQRPDPLELVHAVRAADARQLGGDVHAALHARVRRQGRATSRRWRSRRASTP